MEPLILDNRHPLASAVEVNRPWHLGMTAQTMPVAAEYIDLTRADPMEAADLCSDRAEMAKAMAVCSAACRDVANPTEGVVYIATPKSGEVSKVGKAVNPASRLNSLQTGHWEELDFHALFWCVKGGVEALERATLHALEGAGMRIRGEWFNCAPEFAAMAVAVAAKELGFKVADSTMWLRQREAIRQQRSTLELRTRPLIRAIDTTRFVNCTDTFARGIV